MTFRLVVQCLSQLHHRVPPCNNNCNCNNNALHIIQWLSCYEMPLSTTITTGFAFLTHKKPAVATPRPYTYLSWIQFNIITSKLCNIRFQCPRAIRRGSAAARLLGLWVRIPPAAWMSVCCECCVLPGRGLCNGLITRPEVSYRLRCV